MNNVQRLVSPYKKAQINFINRNNKHLMNYIVYITINLCNGKFYIGVHRTNPKVFDGYIGCGIYSQADANRGHTTMCKAVKKYGYSNFRRTTICVFPYTEEGKQKAYALEKTLVNDTLLRSKYVYNECRGGECNRTLDSLKPVYMFDLTGKFLRRFSQALEAAQFLNLTNLYSTEKAIRNCCLGKTQQSFGYFWSYEKKFKASINNRVTPVAQYTYSGKFIRYFDSMSEAERELHISTIDQAIRNKCLAGGYQWRKFLGDTSDISVHIPSSLRYKVIPIAMYSKDGKLLEKFNSIKECIEKHSEFTSSQIARVCNHVIKTHKGFVFKYQDEDIVLPYLKK